MNDLTARRDHDPIHVFGEPADIFDADFVVIRRAGDAAMMNGASDMLAGNAHVNHANINTRHIAGLFYRLLDSVHGLIDIGNDAFDNTLGLCLTQAEHFELTILIFATYDDTDFCSPDIKADYYFFFFHGC